MSDPTAAAAFPFYASMLEEADRCRLLAREAVDEGDPVRAREWLEAAGAAYRAAHLPPPPLQPTPMYQPTPMQPTPSPTVQPGFDMWQCPVCSAWSSPGQTHRCGGRTFSRAAA